MKCRKKPHWEKNMYTIDHRALARALALSRSLSLCIETAGSHLPALESHYYTAENERLRLAVWVAPALCHQLLYYVVKHSTHTHTHASSSLSLSLRSAAHDVFEALNMSK